MLEDAELISLHLKVPSAHVQTERVLIDDYREYYSVFFEVTGVSKENIKSGMVDYKIESKERESLYLHRTGIRQLKHLKWGPLGEYKKCQEVVGVWDGKYLVYLAVCGDVVHGYFENNYNEPPGPGPFN